MDTSLTTSAPLSADAKAPMARILGAIAIAVVLLGVLHIGVQAGIRHWPVDGVIFAVPLAPGRAIDMHIWSHDLAFSPKFTTSGLTRQRFGPLRATIWYRDTVTAFNMRLAMVRLPIWPLLLIVTAAAIAVPATYVIQSELE